MNASQDQIYAFLEKCIESEKSKKTDESSMSIPEIRVKCEVELKGNRFYQRNLYLNVTDLDYLKPFIIDDAYVKANYEFTEEQLSKFTEMEVDTMNPTVECTTDRKFIADMAKAYNQDISENREAVIFQQGTRVANVFMDNYDSNVVYSMGEDTIISNAFNSAYFTVTDQMTYCVDVLKKYGMEDKITIPKAEDIKAIRFDLGNTVIENCTEEILRQAAEEAFLGYAIDKEPVIYSDSWKTFDFYSYEYYDIGTTLVGTTEKIAVWEKDPAKIENLMTHIHFSRKQFSINDYASFEVILEMKDGREFLGILDCGDFVDEYIEKFAELGRQYETEGHGITE